MQVDDKSSCASRLQKARIERSKNRTGAESQRRDQNSLNNSPKYCLNLNMSQD